MTSRCCVWGSGLILGVFLCGLAGCHKKAPEEAAGADAKVEPAVADAGAGASKAADEAEAAKVADAKRWEQLEKELQACPGAPSTAGDISRSMWIPPEAPATLLLDPGLLSRLTALSQTMFSFAPGVMLVPRSGQAVVTQVDAEWLVGGVPFRLERVLAGPVAADTLPGGGWTYGFGPDSAWCATPGVSCDLDGNVRSVLTGESVLRFKWEKGKLVQVVDSTGSKIEFRYFSDGQPKDVVLPDGQTLSYTFGSGGMLERVAGPMGKFGYLYQGKERLLGITRESDHTVFSYDTLGRLVGVELPGKLNWKVEYTQAVGGYRASIQDPAGGVAAVFEPIGGETMRITNAAGDVTTKKLDGSGRLVALEEPAGRTTRLVWDASGRLASAVLPGGVIRQFVWGDFGLVQVGDGVHKVALEYDGSGRLKGMTDEFGRAWRWERDACGRSTRREGPEGTLQYTYDLSGRLTQVADAGGRTQKRVLDTRGRVIRLEDSLRGSWKLSYDLEGRLAKQTDPGGGTIGYTWDNTGRLVQSMDEAGRTTLYVYDKSGRLAEAKRNGVLVYQAEYDVLGRETKVFDGRSTRLLKWTKGGLLEASRTEGGADETYSYDQAGRLTKRTLDGKVVWLGTWDASGRLASEVDESGQTIRYEYDSLGRLVSRSAPASLAVVWNADGTGTVTHESGLTQTVVALAGAPTSWRVLESLRPDGLKVGYTYSSEGWLAAETRSSGEQVTWEYDASGRPTVWKSNWRGSTTYQWDTLGRLVSVKEANGVLRTLVYSDQGTLIQVKLGDDVYGVEWDPAGRLAALVDASGKRAQFAYTASGQLERTSGFDELAATTSYGASGHLTGYSLPSMPAVEYRRDAQGRLTEVQASGKSWRRLTYTAEGRIAADSGPMHDVQYSYDPSSHLEALVDSKTFARLTFLRDRQGRPTQVLGLGQTLATYEYDEANRPSRLKGPGTLGATLVYDSQGRVLETRFDSGLKATYGRDDAGRVAQETWFSPAGSQLVQLKYRYDAAGRLTGKSVDESQYTYAYDSKGRLTSASLPVGGDELYVYDKAGCVAQIGMQMVQQGPGQRAVSGPGGVRTYDAAGMLVARGEAAEACTFKYDSLGRLQEAAGPGGTARFEVDGEGNLTGYSFGPTSQRFLLLEGRTLAALEKGDLKTTYLLPPAGDSPLGFIRDGKSYYYVRDLQGSVLAVVEESGKVVNRYLYAPFGRSLLAQEEVPNPFRFLGRFTDPVSGLVHFPARWMDPVVGSWAAPDLHPGELLQPESWNRYAFLNNDPVNNVDPIGLQAFEWQAGSSSLDAVCGLFQQGKIKAMHAFGKALDGYQYVGAIEKGGWVHDVWVKKIPGSDRVMTIFRDLNEKAQGYYGKPNFTGNIVIPEVPAATSAPAAQPAAQSGSSFGQTLQNGFNAVKAGVQNYGKEMSTTAAGLGGTMGTLSTPVGTLATLPGGAGIIGVGVGAAAVGGGLIGTGLNQIPAVQNGAQAVIGKTMGYDKPQILVNQEKEGELKGPKMVAADKKAIAAGLAKANSGEFPEPKPTGVANGTLGLGGVPGPEGATGAEGATGKKKKPGSSAGGDIQAPPDASPQVPDITEQPDGEGDKPDTHEPPKDVQGDTSGIENVTPVYISVPIRTEEDASYGEFKNIVTCVGTLSFWNVGALVPGKGGVVMKFTCTASLNNVNETFTNTGTFSGGPNGVFTIQGEHNSGTFQMNGGASVTIPDAGTYPNPNPGAFANWPK